MCFYASELNHNDDLSLEEIRKISENMPKFNNLLISGGEPFLRRDMFEIVELFVCNNKVRSISIPTNGSFPDRIFSETKKMVESFKEQTFNISFSLDGLEDIHNKIRGNEFAYRRVIESIEVLAKLKSKHKNLFININIVISRLNYKHIFDLVDHLCSIKHIDRYSFEVVRGVKANLLEIDNKSLRDIYRKVLEVYPILDSSLPWLSKYLEYIQLAYRFSLQYRYIVKRQNWKDLDCMAGQTIFVMDHDGYIRTCELRNKIKNIREESYNFNHILNSPEMVCETNSIIKTRCSCSHVCFIYESMPYNKRVLFYILPIYFMGFLLFRKFTINQLLR